ncbi:hypothetical protein G9A89_000155 [Geosiphon pyriformis]|nr:hypothetical protein G9A89_002355 [Geosiphon pyriformis]KAG9298187.1 hypothetical protein G9A89_000155 [Geosiphon pyriformis]
MENPKNHDNPLNLIKPEEIIVINVGGIKYETYPSTLTAYPETLLGAMLLKGKENGRKENQLFFKRNGRAFYFIMEYYRTTKFLWSPDRLVENQTVSQYELESELHYFQMPINIEKSEYASSKEKFKKSIETTIIEAMKEWNHIIQIGIFMTEKTTVNYDGKVIHHDIEETQIPIFLLASLFKDEICGHIEEIFEGCQCKQTFGEGQTTFLIFLKYDTKIMRKLARMMPYEINDSNFISQGDSSNEKKLIILNVGGFKHELYPSTFSRFNNSFLGVMFSDRNSKLLHPRNGNEFFIDRNGQAFHFILEYYFTGRITWSPSTIVAGSTITKQELDEELDYFQILNPVIDHAEHLTAHLELGAALKRLVSAIEGVITSGMEQSRDLIQIDIFRDTPPEANITGIPENFYIPLEQKLLWDLTFHHAAAIQSHLEIVFEGSHCEYDCSAETCYFRMLLVYDHELITRYAALT